MGNDYFKKRVKSLREKKGLTMEQLAREVGGINKSRINMWENNGTVPRMEVLVKLAQYFGVTTDYLLGNDSTTNLSEENSKLNSLQRNLGKLNENELETATRMLKAVFMDIFNDDDEENSEDGTK
ncbi:helix-turn-helix transcriptional regulator [bacterium]|nr:helix-turn-helix transcriptional regulator [bacterium]